MIVIGVGLIAAAVLANGLWGPIRILLVLGGLVLVVPGFLLGVNVKGLNVGASSDGGIRASADRTVGYIRTMRISDSLVEGTPPPKIGTPPPKTGTPPPREGTMPPKQTPRG